LVTHEAPGYHLHGFDVFDQLARSMAVKIAACCFKVCIEDWLSGV
jgi:hypothetical protein